jgi:hypothetical protein
MGPYLRTEIHSRRIGPVLPITIEANDPDRIDIDWAAAPNLSDAAAVGMDEAVEKMQARVAETFTNRRSRQQRYGVDARVPGGRLDRRDTGVISMAEFEQQKAQILGGG